MSFSFKFIPPLSDTKYAKNGTNKCSKCGKDSFGLISGGKLTIFEVKQVEQIVKVLKSHKDPYKKKLDLFNLVKKFEVGEIEPTEERRLNVLYQGKIYNELAKQSLKDYKKLTAEEFSRVNYVLYNIDFLSVKSGH